MKSIVILISGRGTNLAALIAAQGRESWPSRIVSVISSRRGAPALAVAQSVGIATAVVDPDDFASRDDFDDHLARVVASYRPDWVLLAGFMRILSRAMVSAYEGRMLNIHPSLLPAFKGLHTHRQALAAGVRIHGTTVHFVSPELDHGPIVAQALVPVLPGDSETELSERVKAQEHRLYPRVVGWAVHGRLALRSGQVEVDAAPDELLLEWTGEEQLK